MSDLRTSGRTKEVANRGMLAGNAVDRDGADREREGLGERLNIHIGHINIEKSTVSPLKIHFRSRE